VQHPAGCVLSATRSSDFTRVRLDIVRPDGSIACSSLPSATRAAAHHGAAWLAQALHSASPLVTRTIVDGVTHRPSIAIAAPLGSPSSNLGVVAVVLDATDVARSLAATYAGPQRNSFTIVNRADRHLISTSASHRAASTTTKGAAFAAAGGTWRGLDGHAQLFRSADVAALGWRVFAGIRADSITADARTAFIRQALMTAAGALALAVILFVLFTRIVRPLRRVTHAIVAARDEPLPSAVPIEGPSEIAALACEFNTMLDGRLQYEAELNHQALHDRLTGLPNRALLRDRLERVLQERVPGTTPAVLFLDLNRFKAVNDTLGHPVGDELLREVAARLASRVRPGDTLARFGGDEFVVICQGGSAAQDAAERAEAVAGAFTEPFAVAGTEITVTAAIGIAVASAANDPDELIREADIAMYHAKTHGLSVAVCNDEMRSLTRERFEVERDLVGALDRNELVVHYQPIFDLDTLAVVGLEALVRWQHPKHGLLLPARFIPAAEETGAIVGIGTHVLNVACHQVAALNACGHELRLAVNLAAAQLDSTLPVVVANALERSGLGAEYLCLELTESSFVSAFAPAARTLTRIRQTGVRIGVDDFGTGYSSLSYLQHFTFDILKIDRSFVERLGRAERSDALTKAILEMSRVLELDVVAEGVETPAQLNRLRELGCRHAQGYLLDRPMPFDELTKRLPRLAADAHVA
jgi:diguanylate cyclase (GGDEF)-like protein